MKRKRTSERRWTLLKLHIAFFIVFMICMWLSVISTFSYPGNAGVPFEVFKPFLIQRMDFNILWGVALLAHFGVVELRDWWQRRSVNGKAGRFNLADDVDGTRLRDEAREADGELPLVYQDARQLRQRS